MTVSIKVEEPEEQSGIILKVAPKKEEKPRLEVTLDARKTLDGDILIFSHEDMDIAIMPSTKKIVAFPKDRLSDDVYAAQSRLLDYLSKRGVIGIDSIKGGNMYGSLQGVLLDSAAGFEPVDLALLNIAKFIEEEKPDFEYRKKYEEEEVDRLTNPTEEDSTELGEVPQSEKKGSISPYQTRRYAGGIAGV